MARADAMTAGVANALDQHQVRARRRVAAQALIVLLVSLVTGALVLAFPPGWPAVFLCAGALFISVTWYRPIIGVATILGATLMFEQFDFAYFRPITRAVPFFDNISHLGSPLEILLVAVAAVLLVQAAIGKRPIQANPLALPALALVCALAVWFLYGAVSGGQVTVALWELRGLSYFLLLVLIVPQAVTTLRDVTALLWVAIVTVGIKAMQGIWNYVVILRGDSNAVRSVTGHEDALFIAWMTVLLVGLMLYRTAPRQRTTLLALSPVLAFTFVVTDRRAAYVALVLGLMFLAAIVAADKSQRARIARWGLPALLAVALIIAAGWNNQGALGFPAQTVKSIVSPENKEDADSTLYRKLEQNNLMRSITANPVVGLGFGRPFQSPGQEGIIDVGFSLENVIPHNEILWIWAKMGTVGFALFWSMIGGVIAYGVVMFKTLRDPYLRVIAALVPSAVAMQMVVSYVDLQLTYARNMVFLGVLVGILACLSALDGGESDDVAV